MSNAKMIPAEIRELAEKGWSRLSREEYERLAEWLAEVEPDVYDEYVESTPKWEVRRRSQRMKEGQPLLVDKGEPDEEAAKMFEDEEDLDD